MAGSMLKIDIRRGKILEKLKQEGAVSVSKLASELGATPVTIRNDLDALEKDGYLVRVQGGAVSKSRSVTDPLEALQQNIPMFRQKVAIARQVAQQISDGDTLFINAGTTMQVVAAALKDRKNLNIVTNALSIALELGTVPTFRVILLGGEVNAQYGFTHGSDAQEALSHYQADWALLSLDGISATGGMTTLHAEEYALDRMMLSQANQTLIAADHTKIGRTGFFRFADVKAGIGLVTDRNADRQAIADLKDAGVNVTIVSE